MFVHIKHASTLSGTQGGMETMDHDRVELMWKIFKLLFAWDYWSDSAHIYRWIHDPVLYVWCVYSHRWIYTHHNQSATLAGTVEATWRHAHTLFNTETYGSPITAQGYFPPYRLMLCQCASCCPRLALLISCFFDRRTETDSMICTPAQTCPATSVPMIWQGNAWEWLGLVVLHFQVELPSSSGWAAAEFNVSLKSTLFSVDDDHHVMHFPVHEIGSWYSHIISVCLAHNGKALVSWSLLE